MTETAGDGAVAGANVLPELATLTVPPALREKWRRRAAELSRPAETYDDLRMGGNKYLLIGIGREQYALRVEEVEEIMRVPVITPVPCLPPHFSGVMNRRGSILTVIDLHVFFGGTRERVARDGRIVVIAAGGRSLGLLVSGADRIVNMPADSLGPPMARSEGVHEEFCAGVLTHDRRIMVLIDTRRLLEDDRMTVDSAP